jgi:WD40 repeat protein
MEASEAREHVDAGRGGSARRQATAAVAERLGAQALVDPNFDQSLLLAREGVNLDDSATTRSNLLADLLRNPAAIGIAREGSDRLLDEALSPDGHWLAIGEADDAVALADLRTGRRTNLRSHGSPDDVDFSPDGTILASASLDGTATPWNVVTKKPVRRLSGAVSAFTVAFSPDGKLVAVGDNSGTVVLWDAARGTRVGTPLVAHNGGVSSMDFDHTGRMLATVQGDGNVRLWDVAARKLIGGSLPSGTGGGTVMFFPDGKHFVATLGSGSGIVWDVDPAAWKARACSVAGRNLTRAEWTDFLGGRAFRDVCPTRASPR